MFLHTSIKISENFDIKTSAMEQNRFIQRNKKKKILRRDTLQISVAVLWRCTVKKMPLKVLPPVYLHIIKIDIK